jgi:gamma-glutamylcyclotransferase (GGCT)/AIG2-like uncharacterized protein YtfP
MNHLGDDQLPRLAVYGTLAPGRPNHGQLAHVAGRWSAGVVHGHLLHAGWGADLGFPGLVLDDGGEEIDVQILESAGLEAEWPRLDAFEGPGYRRVTVEVTTMTGSVAADIYVLATGPNSPSGADRG